MSQRQFTSPPTSLLYEEDYLSRQQSDALVEWLLSLRPLWEKISKQGEPERWLLRPVYWLGNWQFACLGYYHPPKGILHRSVEAEPFPPLLQSIVNDIENKIHNAFRAEDIPQRWKLNTLLVNYYGSKKSGDSTDDCARVGEHRDFEPGPVASLSFGERALFQFVKSHGKHHSSHVIWQKWLEHGSLQAFAGPKWKKDLFHRVQRVDRREKFSFPISVKDFDCRRINLTFRYVPDEHIVAFSELPADLRGQVITYLSQLAQHSEFFRRALTS